jgi:hypothetical protein
VLLSVGRRGQWWDNAVAESFFAAAARPAATMMASLLGWDAADRVRGR